MQHRKSPERHLLYFRFAFPVPSEPGPKRPLDIIERYRDRGYRVTVITSGGNYMTGESSRRGLLSRSTEQGIDFIRVAAIRGYRSSLIKRLLNYALFTLLAFWGGLLLRARKGGRETIFVDISPPFAVLGGFALSRLRRSSRLVLEITDLPETVFEIGMFTDRFWKRLTFIVFRYLYRAADHIVALTPGAMTHIIEMGVEPGNISLVPNWVADNAGEVDRQMRDAIRRKMGWDTSFVVLYAGGLGQAYDIMTLLKAAEALRDMPRVTIVIMGEGERRNEYAEYCEARNLSACTFPGPVPRAELRSLLTAADACVNLFYPGDFWNRVVGHKIIDYLEARRPVIFAGGGDTADIIRRSGGGIVVGPGDPDSLARAIRRMAENPAEAARMGENGYAFLAREMSREKILPILDGALFPQG